MEGTYEVVSVPAPEAIEAAKEVLDAVRNMDEETASSMPEIVQHIRPGKVLHAAFSEFAEGAINPCTGTYEPMRKWFALYKQVAQYKYLRVSAATVESLHSVASNYLKKAPNASLQMVSGHIRYHAICTDD